jgi:hypothetical protein
MFCVGKSKNRNATVGREGGRFNPPRCCCVASIVTECMYNSKQNRPAFVDSAEEVVLDFAFSFSVLICCGG